MALQEEKDEDSRFWVEEEVEVFSPPKQAQFAEINLLESSISHFEVYVYSHSSVEHKHLE